MFIDTISNADNPADAARGFYEVEFVKQPDKSLYREYLFINTILESCDVDNELSAIAAHYVGAIGKNRYHVFFKVFFQRDPSKRS